jgi:hypothetical protein
VSEWEFEFGGTTFRIDCSTYRIEQYTFPEGADPAQVLADALFFDDRRTDGDEWQAAP